MVYLLRLIIILLTSSSCSLVELGYEEAQEDLEELSESEVSQLDEHAVRESRAEKCQEYPAI